MSHRNLFVMMIVLVVIVLTLTASTVTAQATDPISLSVIQPLGNSLVTSAVGVTGAYTVYLPLVIRSTVGAATATPTGTTTRTTTPTQTTTPATPPGNTPSGTPVPPTHTPTNIPTETQKPPTPTTVTCPVVYIVQPGDTLSSIASKFNVSMNAIMQLNNISDETILYPGMVLLIPIPCP